VKRKYRYKALAFLKKLSFLLFITFVVSCTYISEVHAQQLEVPVEVKRAFENAMIEEHELPNKSFYTINGNTSSFDIDLYIIRDGEWDEYEDGASYRKAWSSDNSGLNLVSEFIDIVFSYNDWYPDSDAYIQAHDTRQFERYSALPFAVYSGPTLSGGSGPEKYKVEIRFWKNEWVQGYITIWLSTPDYALSEAERLAQIVYSRLPNSVPGIPGSGGSQTTPPPTSNETPGSDLSPGDIQLITPPPASDPPSTPTEYSTPATSPPSDYSPPTSGPGLSGPGERIPDGALPVAAGAAAAVAAIGALGVAAANGVPAAQALGELQGLLSGRQAQPGGTRSAQDIVANPNLHDKVVDDNGKEWVYYKPTGDQAETPSWVSKDNYEQEMKHLRSGKFWDNTHGWIDADRQAEIEKNRQIFEQGNIKDSEKLREAIRQDQAENARQMQAEIDRRNAIMNKRLELEDLELQNKLDQYSLSDVLRDTTRGTSREIFTGVGKTFDPETGTYVDSFSAKSMGLRILSGLASGGVSELFFNPVDGSYRVLDRMAEGQSFGSALYGTVKDMTIEELTGKGLAKVGQLTAGLMKQGNPLASTLGRQSDGLTDALKHNSDALESALSIKDPARRAEQIKALYKDGGVKKLAELEKAGKLSAKQAAEINKVVTGEVNDAVTSSTTKTMKDFRVAGKDGIRVEVEGVKVKDVMVGDSGSSARPGKGRSILTDHDRTTYVSFDNDSLVEYARRNDISIEEAHKRLNKTFVDQQQANLDRALQARGLEPGDVEQKIFSSIEKKGGKVASGSVDSDVYPSGYTATRQAVQGKTEIYAVDRGQVKTPYTSSGEAMTDRMVMDGHNKSVDINKGPVIGGDPKARLEEAKLLATNQSESLAGISSAEKAAKALERIDKSAALADCGRVPPELADTARQLRNNPQETLARLGSEGQRQFIEDVQRHGSEVIEKVLDTKEVIPPWLKNKPLQ